MVLDDVNSVRGLGGLAGESYIDKDLRTPLETTGALQPELLRRGLAEGVPRPLWFTLHVAADQLAAQFGNLIRPRG